MSRLSVGNPEMFINGIRGKVPQLKCRGVKINRVSRRSARQTQINRNATTWCLTPLDVSKRLSRGQLARLNSSEADELIMMKNHSRKNNRERSDVILIYCVCHKHVRFSIMSKNMQIMSLKHF